MHPRESFDQWLMALEAEGKSRQRWIVERTFAWLGVTGHPKPATCGRVKSGQW